MQTCLNDETAAYQQALAAIPSCSSVTAAKLASLVSGGADAGTADPIEPTSCSKFDSTCNRMTSM